MFLFLSRRKHDQCGHKKKTTSKIKEIPKAIENVDLSCAPSGKL